MYCALADVRPMTGHLVAKGVLSTGGGPDGIGSESEYQYSSTRCHYHIWELSRIIVAQ